MIYISRETLPVLGAVSGHRASLHTRPGCILELVSVVLAPHIVVVDLGDSEEVVAAIDCQEVVSHSLFLVSMRQLLVVY